MQFAEDEVKPSGVCDPVRGIDGLKETWVEVLVQTDDIPGTFEASFL